MTASTTAVDRRRLTVLRAARLFDGISSTLIDNPVVVFDGPQIVSVDVGDRYPAGEPSDVIELGESTLLPGLIDTHVHLCFDAGPDVVTALAGRDDAAALAAMADAARSALAGGVTTVRDLGDRNYLALHLRERGDLGPLPTIVAAGPPITSPQGHCHYLGGEALGVSGVRDAVRQHAERGVDVVKIMASGGHLTPGTHADQPQFSPAELRAAVDEANRFSLPVTAHAHATTAIAQALDAGVDGLEHVTFQSGGAITPAPEDLVRAITDRHVVVGATLGWTPVSGVPMPPQLAAGMPTLMANLRALVDAGASIVLGTDGGIAPPKPHDVLRYAVGQFAALGPGPVEALRTATSRAAQVVGLAHRKGRLAPGYDADVLAVDGDPTTDPAALHRIRAVYFRGTPVHPLTVEQKRDAATFTQP